MGLQGFEQRMERLVAGVFTRGAGSRVLPVELGRRLLREIEDQRTIDARGRRVVPNAFSFWLSAADHAGFVEFESRLTAELCETARQYALSEGFVFVGPVTVELHVDADLRPGRFEVEGRVVEPAVTPGGGALILPNGDRVPIGKRVVTIGRKEDCTICLQSANVSRQHCEVRAAGSLFVVVDLGSTNGTKVNGVRVAVERILEDSDIISVGGINIRFEAS